KINCHYDIKKGDSFLTGCSYKDGFLGDGSDWRYIIRFSWQSVDKIEPNVHVISVPIPEFVWDGAESIFNIQTSYIVAKKQDYIYCFVRVGEKFTPFKWNPDSDGWQDFNELEDYYAPRVIEDNVQITGYNLLGGRYEANWNFNNGEDPASYTLPQTIPKKSKIKVTLMNSLGLVEENIFEFTANSDSETVTKDFFDGTTKIDIVREPISYINIYDSASSSKLNIGSVDGGSLIGGYVLVNAVCDVSADAHKVYCMTRSTWFGGAANGINGGSRLFLCGNTEEKEKNLIMWSGVNNPLYFNENCYAYVGDKSQAVTAFGQQGENLIIFKESSTYYSYYATNSEIDAEALINQSVVDYEVNSEYFPIVQLNNTIGCNCPDTVQLCRNRLVWTDNDGTVYVLLTKNEYSERNIYIVSSMIEQKLSKEIAAELKTAVACDFDGHYVLIVGNHAYVMDYNSYGYQYIHSYSKSEDGNAMIPWYYWEFPKNADFSVRRYCPFGNFIIALECDTTLNAFSIISSALNAKNFSGNDNYLVVVDRYENEISNKTEKIRCRLQTKLFDMRAPHHSKNIEKVVVGFGNNGGDEITVGLVSNVGTETESVVLASGDTDESDAAYISVKSFYPCARSVRSLGVSLECQGLLTVDSLSLQYRLLGGIK
ncbi:MAG: hypothetical protein IJY79_06040, partial [Clostridia bacterium]|nr:hypothetical protein [Clostridia bacterium]